jgi:hypothetical protein
VLTLLASEAASDERSAALRTGDQQPTGALDPIVGRTLRGWAYDADYSSEGQHLELEVYLDGPVRAGRKLGTTWADLPSEPEVGGNGAVRFQYTLPSSVDGAIHYLYVYARGRLPGGAPAGLTLLEHAPRQTGRAPADAPSIYVTYRDGSTFDSGNAIRRYALGRTAEGSRRVYALADDKYQWSYVSWGAAAYSGQGALISEKLLSFGSKESDFQRVREWLLEAPIDAEGVFATGGGKRALDEMLVSDANAEYIIMARDFLSFTGERIAFDKTAEHFMCIRESTGQWSVTTPSGKYTSDICGNLAVARTDTYFDQPLYPPSERSPGVILGQYFTAQGAFDALKLGLRRTHRCSPPFRVYLNSGMGTVFMEEFPATTTPLDEKINNAGIEVPLGRSFPAGTYFIEVHPWRALADTPLNPYAIDAALRTCLEEEEAPTMPEAISPYWYGYRWHSDGAPLSSGGATNKVFRDETEAFGPAEFVNLRAKLATALQAQLTMARKPEGVMGIYIIQDVLYRGTAENGVAAANYYDLIKSGFKDSYTNLRFLESLDAYLDLQAAGAVGRLPSGGPGRMLVHERFWGHGGGGR